MKVVIVGGVAGGASAAARIRRLDEHAQIIMIERSGYVSYANCGLPYYVGGVIVDREELTLQTPESFWDRFRIDVRVRQEVTAINPTEKTVTVHALDSGKVYTETYDKLLLAPGAKPTVPALSGVDSERVFTLRTVEDTLRIRRFVEDQKPKTAVLAGGGFIGLEMAENLVEMGVSVTIVQRPKQLLAPLDTDMASFVHAEMRRHGVALRLGETVTGFRQDGDSVRPCWRVVSRCAPAWCCWPSASRRTAIWQKMPDLSWASGAASLSTSGWKPPYRISTLWAMP